MSHSFYFIHNYGMVSILIPLTERRVAMPEEASIPVPRTLDEFNAGLGEAILIKAAERWRAYYDEELANLARLAQRAEELVEAGQAQDSLMSDLFGDLYEVNTFLTDAEPDYLMKVVTAGIGLEGQEFQDFLKLLQQLSE